MAETEETPPPPEPSPEARRLEGFTERLERAQAEEASRRLWRAEPGPPPGASLGLALRIGVELVSATAVGGGIGWLLDNWLGSRPWLMVTLFLLGGAAGILNVYRVVRRLGYAAGYGKDDGADGARSRDGGEE